MDRDRQIRAARAFLKVWEKEKGLGWGVTKENALEIRKILKDVATGMLTEEMEACSELNGGSQ